VYRHPERMSRDRIPLRIDVGLAWTSVLSPEARFIRLTERMRLGQDQRVRLVRGIGARLPVRGAMRGPSA
jgi:hypothetical protein